VKYRESVGIEEQSIDEIDQPAAFVHYRSQQAAFTFLGNVLSDDRGIGLLHGPKSSGKSLLINQFVRELQTDVAVAVVDGTRLKTPEMLSGIIEQFGYHVELNSTGELLNMLRVIMVQQTRSHRAPVLIVENINDMFPSTLCVLCKLAAQTVHKQFAMRIILFSNRYFRRIIDSPSMSPIADRLIGDFVLKPLTAQETLVYLYAELKSFGVDQPHSVFSVDICSELHAASGGWPGKLDDIAMSIMEQAENFPIGWDDIDHPDCRSQAGGEADMVEVDTSADEESPKLIVTLYGETLQEIEMVDSRALIGRSDVSDIVIEGQFVSRQHAILIRDQDAVILIDIKSRNGSFVNSRRVTSKVLRDNDIISIGDHRIKLIYPSACASVYVEDPDIADTATMKTIADARQARTGENQHLAAVDKQKA